MTILPITADQYISGLQKYIRMLRAIKTEKDYVKIERYWKVLESHSCITNSNTISALIAGELVAISQRIKQYKLKEIFVLEYSL